ncbi:MAG: DUF2163 domain-containing protein [Pseudomonadota bacterium]
MKYISTALQAHLDTGATTLCTCWQIKRKDGQIFGFTDHDRPLTILGYQFLPETGADGSKIASSNDLSVDNSSILGALNSDRLNATDLAAGKFDDAEIEIWRVNWQNVTERTLLQRATLGETIRTGDSFTVELRGPTHPLSNRVGRVFQRQCDAVLGDDKCKVNLNTSAFKGNGAITEIVDEQTFRASGLSTFDTGWFAHGVLTWSSGNNAGVLAHVKSNTLVATDANQTSITLWLPSGASLSVGDSFSITAGCPRTHEACKEKFDNLINFRGFHLMPGNDFAVSYPIRSDNNDGGKR